jgi:MraZ protein
LNFAELQKEVVLSSSINMVEIWDKNKYEQVLNDPDLDFAALAEEVMGGPTPEEND